MRNGNRLPGLQEETVESFAKRIRRRFPKNYDDVPDRQLVEEWLEKYPQYRTRFAPNGEPTGNRKGLPSL